MKGHDELIQAVLKRALNENFVFPAVEARKNLCDAMYRRHYDEIKKCVEIITETGKLLLIYICNFHVLSHLLLIYICKLHWNLNTMFVCQVNYF